MKGEQFIVLKPINFNCDQPHQHNLTATLAKTEHSSGVSSNPPELFKTPTLKTPPGHQNEICIDFKQHRRGLRKQEESAVTWSDMRCVILTFQCKMTSVHQQLCYQRSNEFYFRSADSPEPLIPEVEELTRHWK